MELDMECRRYEIYVIIFQTQPFILKIIILQLYTLSACIYKLPD